MTNNPSNPFGTGGGGHDFENKVQSAFLLVMLVRGCCPCLPSGEIVSIRFQSKQAGYETDDFLVQLKDGDGQPRRLLAQVKHGIRFTESNAEYQTTLQCAWEDFLTRDRFDPDRDAIAIISEPFTRSEVNDYRPVLDWARHCTTAAEFFRKVATPQFSSDRKRSFINIIKKILSEYHKPPSNDEELWKFIKTLHLLNYDFDVVGGKDEANFLTLISLGKSENSVSDQSLWSQICQLVSEFNRDAGTIDAQTLDQALASKPELRHAFKNKPSILEHESIRRLRTQSDAILNGISLELTSGVSIPRVEEKNQFLQIVQENRVIIVTGEAGIGKSALVKTAIQSLPEAIPVFIFKASEFDHPGLHQALVAMGIQEGMSQFSASFSLLPMKWLVIDSAEKLLELRHDDAFTQLLGYVNNQLDWRIILTCRSHGVDGLNNILLRRGMTGTLFQVPNLPMDKLRVVSARAIWLPPLLAQPNLLSVLSIPFFLRLAFLAVGGTLGHTNTMTAHELKSYLWKEAIRKNVVRRGGLPQRREEAFVAMAVERARVMGDSVAVRGLDPEAIAALETDGILRQDDRGRYVPTHDVFADWALICHLEHSFDGSSLFHMGREKLSLPPMR